MTERAGVGSRWRRRRDGTVWRVRQCWRKDRLAHLEVVDTLGQPMRRLVTFDQLRDRHEELQR